MTSMQSLFLLPNDSGLAEDYPSFCRDERPGPAQRVRRCPWAPWSATGALIIVDSPPGTVPGRGGAEPGRSGLDSPSTWSTTALFDGQPSIISTFGIAPLKHPSINLHNVPAGSASRRILEELSGIAPTGLRSSSSALPCNSASQARTPPVRPDCGTVVQRSEREGVRRKNAEGRQPIRAGRSW